MPTGRGILCLLYGMPKRIKLANAVQKLMAHPDRLAYFGQVNLKGRAAAIFEKLTKLFNLKNLSQDSVIITLTQKTAQLVD